MKTWIHFVLVTALVALTACGDDTYTVDVRVVTSLVPGPQFNNVEVTLLTSAPLYEPARSVSQSRSAANFGDDFVHGRDVASFSGLQLGEHVVHVRLLRPDGTLLIGRRLRFQLGGNAILPITLTPDCVGVMCPSPTGSPTLNACFGGQCVDERCNPPDDLEFCPELEFCNTPADCIATLPDCATALCEQGICLSGPSESACAENEWCDPTAGCVPREVSLDAGIEDAGDAALDMDVDAGVDLGEVIDAGNDHCGEICELESDPCHVGAIDCAGEEPTCRAYATRPTGTACGESMYCTSSGECAACVSGTLCSVGCRTGAIACGATGRPTCDLGDGTAFVATGGACSNDSVCLEGESCGTGETCSIDHDCESCDDDGAACTLEGGCQIGTVSCSLGHICVPAMNAPYGTRCARTGAGVGDISICDESGTCNECVDGSACVLPSACGAGRLICDPMNPYGYPVGVCDLTPSLLSGGLPHDDITCDGGVCGGFGMCVEPLVAMKLGHHVACAIRADGSVGCWGSVGRPYHGGTLIAYDITTVAGLPPLISLTGGLGVSVDGELWEWSATVAPHVVTLPERALDVRAGSWGFGSENLAVACVLLESGQLMCRGDRRLNGTGSNRVDFYPLADLDDVVAFDAGGRTAVAVESDGTVRSWGYRWHGVAGDGSIPTGGGSESEIFMLAPVTAADAGDLVQVSNENSGSTCGARSDGSVACWGAPFGVASDPLYGFPQTYVPTDVPLAFSDVLSVSVVYGGLCMLRSIGEVWCYGSHSIAGRGGYPGAFVSPGPVLHVSDAVELSGTCARTSAGAVYCWPFTEPFRVGQSLPFPEP